MKYCPRCEETKPFTEFYKNRASHDGHQSYCKPCIKPIFKAYNATEAGSARTQRYWRSDKGRAAMQAANDRVKGGPAKKAHNSVANAVRTGKIKSARERDCILCGGRARHYHHRMGYEPEHHLNVIPVCVSCHKGIESGGGS